MSHVTPDIDMETEERYVCVHDSLDSVILLFVFVYLSNATIPILQVSGEMYDLCLCLFLCNGFLFMFVFM